MPFFFGTLLGAALILGAGYFRRINDWLEEVSYALIFCGYPFVLVASFSILDMLHPHTVDLYLLRCDLALGLDPTVFMRFAYQTEWLKELLTLTYYGLPVALALSWVIDRSLTMVRSCVIGMVAAYVIYNIVPAVGPVHAFFWGTRDLVPFDQLAKFPRNCFPSMHLGFALFIAFNATRRDWKILTWLFVLLTAVATIGSGEHYYTDLIAAVPFCVAVQWVAERWTATTSHQAVPASSSQERPAF